MATCGPTKAVGRLIYQHMAFGLGRALRRRKKRCGLSIVGCSIRSIAASHANTGKASATFAPIAITVPGATRLQVEAKDSIYPLDICTFPWYIGRISWSAIVGNDGTIGTELFEPVSELGLGSVTS